MPCNHSKAQYIRGKLSYRNEDLCLEMEDDGCGFDVAQEHSGFGLVGIQERADEMGGQLCVDSQPGYGTRMSVVIPTEKAAAIQ